LAPSNSPNTDGFDPDSSSDVLFENSYVSNGDDAVAIKSGWDCFGVKYGVPSKNILIRNLITFTSSAGVTIGSEMSGGASNITVVNCSFHGGTAFRIKSSLARSGYVRDILVTNNTFYNSANALVINDYYGDPNTCCGVDINYPPPVINNITFTNIIGHTVNVPGDYEGLPDSPITNVFLENITLVNVSGRYTCLYVSGKSKNVTPTPCNDLQG